jgi:hypothetical protein
MICEYAALLCVLVGKPDNGMEETVQYHRDDATYAKSHMT